MAPTDSTSPSDNGEEAAPTGPYNAAAEEPSAVEIDIPWCRDYLSNYDAEECYQALARLVRPNQTSVLSALDYDKSEPTHSPMCVSLPPDVAGLDSVRLYARAAYRDFDTNLVSAFQTPRVSGTLTAIYNRLIHDNSNIAVVTNHGDIIDIALVLAALTIALCDEEQTFGAFDEQLELETLADRSNIMVSKMVATRSAFEIPAITVLQNMCHTFLSVPQTHSRRRARLDPDYIRANNMVMREELSAKLDRGGQLLAMAASGSQDISAASGLWRKIRQLRAARLDESAEAPSLHLQPLYSGTIRLMTSCEYVLPVATSMDADHSVCTVGELTRVRDDDDCHGIMEWLAAAHQDATGITSVYHSQEDDRLSQLREALAKRRPGPESDDPSASAEMAFTSDIDLTVG